MLHIVDLQPKRSASGTVTLLHLSDLHFLATTECTGARRGEYFELLENTIRSIAAETPIDLVVVTGDLIDLSEKSAAGRGRALERASGFLATLCNVVSVPADKGLLVIPGNHDYRWKGTLFFKGAKSDFLKYFEGSCRHVLYPGLNLLVACFDSNDCTHPLELAKGRVNMKEFQQLEAAIRNVASPYGELAQRTRRVALVHHHPLPIAESDEDLDPRSRIDWLLGRKAEGAPEYMLMRNAGTFLHHLLANRFRLVLHGHLHERGYWMPMKQVGDGEDRRWMEVIAAGSAGVPQNDRHASFNVLQIHPTDRISGYFVELSKSGVVRRKSAIPTADYDFVRNHRGIDPTAYPFSAKRITKRWDVYLPSGDLETTEVYDDMRSTVPDGLTSLPFAVVSESMTQSTMQIRSLTESQDIAVEYDAQPSAPGKRQARWTIKFDPPLRQNEISMAFQRMSPGIMFSSVKDKLRFGGGADQDRRDSCTQRIHHPCGQLIISLRFLADPWEGEADLPAAAAPENVSLRVEDMDGNPVPDEVTSAHVCMAYWGPRPLVGSLARGRPIAEAILTVSRPQLNHRYVLWWELPRDDVESSPAVLEHQWNRLRDWPTGMGDPLQAFVDDLQQSLPAFLSGVIPAADWSGLHVSLFGFDPRSSDLTSIRSTGGGANPLNAFRCRWGRQFIGTAFRRRRSIGLNRRKFEAGSVLFEEFPTAVHGLMAIPLYGALPPHESWPIAVVAILSSSQTTGLQAIVDDADQFSATVDFVESKWPDRRLIQ